MKKKLLVVDDDPAVRRFMRRALQGAEYEVIEAADGDEAVESAAAKRPDLVLLDMHMPRLDGIAALSEIMDAGPIPVIMVTGDGDMERVKLAMERGACGYITKPFDLQSLRTSVMDNLLVGS